MNWGVEYDPSGWLSPWDLCALRWPGRRTPAVRFRHRHNRGPRCALDRNRSERRRKRSRPGRWKCPAGCRRRRSRIPRIPNRWPGYTSLFEGLKTAAPDPWPWTSPPGIWRRAPIDRCRWGAHPEPYPAGRWWSSPGNCAHTVAPTESVVSLHAKLSSHLPRLQVWKYPGARSSKDVFQTDSSRGSPGA